MIPNENVRIYYFIEFEGEYKGAVKIYLYIK